MSGQRRHLVVTVHGIRTYGDWQERLEQLVVNEAQGDIEFVNYKFGYFSTISFAIPFLRWLLVRRFRNELTRLCASKEWSRVDVVGHSFGTHVIAWAIAGLAENSRITIHTVLLSGSVLRKEFPWPKYLGTRVARVINDCGSRDNVLLLSQFLVFFTGMAGRSGFIGSTGATFRNRYSPFGHSGYFLDPEGRPSDDYLRERWLPLLTAENPAPAFDLRPPATTFDSAVETLATHAGLIKLAVYFSPFVVLAAVYFSLYLQADAARKTFASQLAANYYVSSQNAASQDGDLPEAVLYAGKAAQRSPDDDKRLPVYLDRFVHLAAGLPQRLVNLPIGEGIRLTSFDESQEYLALVTDSLQVRVFRLSDLAELPVPPSVNRLGNRVDYVPRFSDEGKRIDTLLNWNHPEPDPDSVGRYYLKAGWNVENGILYTPEDDGSIDPERLNWTFVESNSPEAVLPAPDVPNEIREMRFSSDTTGASLKPSKALAVDAGGRLMQWPRPRPPAQIASALISTKKKWARAEFAGERLFTLGGDDVLTCWNIRTKAPLWSKSIGGTGRDGDIKVSPDGSIILVNEKIYLAATGEETPVEGKRDLGWSKLHDIALTRSNSLIEAGTFFDGNRDVLNFNERTIRPPEPDKAAAPANSAGNKQETSDAGAGVDPKPGEFVAFLLNAEFYLFGSQGSIAVADQRSQTLVSRFLFGGRTPLSPKLGMKLLQQAARIERTKTKKTEFHLKGGAVLVADEFSSGSATVLRTRTGEFAVRGPRLETSYRYVALSADAQRLATAGKTGVRVWSAASGYPISEQFFVPGDVRAISFDEEGRHLRIATGDGDVLENRVSFQWPKKPNWLEGAAEALSGLALAEDGTIVRLSPAQAETYRNEFLAKLRMDQSTNSAVRLLQRHQGITRER